MDAEDALQRLLLVSDDVRAAVVFERGGEPLAATLPDSEARDLAALGDALLAYAGTLRERSGVRRLRAVTPAGDVYVVRGGERAVVAVALPGSLAGLVQHDLRTLLGDLSAATSRRRASAPVS